MKRAAACAADGSRERRLPVTTEELKTRGTIYLEKITEGFQSYADVKLIMDEKRAYEHFKSLKKEYGAENSYADFYYFRLDEDSREMVNELLTADEIAYLQILKPLPEETEEEIIFSLDDRLLQIIVKLNAREMLFSTIYFVQPDPEGRRRTSWWGNYGHEYICFRDQK